MWEREKWEIGEREVVWRILRIMASIHLCPIILRMSNINNWITKYFEDGKFHLLNRIFIFVCQDGYVRSWMYYLLQQWNGCFLSHHKWGNYLSWIFQVNSNTKKRRIHHKAKITYFAFKDVVLFFNRFSYKKSKWPIHYMLMSSVKRLK